MANICCFNMKIAGEKKNVLEFVSILQYEHPEERCFARIDEATVFDEYKLPDGRYVAHVEGSCAWSVHTCMREGKGTYFESSHDSKLSTLTGETKRLCLDVEIYSTETGIGFAEHYRYVNGDCLIDEETEYNEYWYFPDEWPSFEAFCKEYNIPEDSDEDEQVFRVGGFPEKFVY